MQIPHVSHRPVDPRPAVEPMTPEQLRKVPLRGSVVGRPAGPGQVIVGVTYLGSDPRVMRDIATVADWVLLPMDEARFEHRQDEVRSLIDAAHEAGLDVVLDPWRVGDVFAGEAKTTLHRRFPEERQMSSDGRVRNSMSPRSPVFQSYVHEWIDAAAKLGADAVMWDEPHYWLGEFVGDPTLYADAGPRAQAAWGGPMPRVATDETRRFQMDALADVLVDFSRHARSHGMAVYTDLTDKPEHQQLFRRMRPWSDNVGVSAYEDVRENVEHLLQGAGPGNAHAWIRAFRVKQGTEDAIVEQSATAYDAGMREFAFWSYRGSEDFADLRSDRPQAVWDATRAAVAMLRSRAAAEARAAG